MMCRARRAAPKSGRTFIDPYFFFFVGVYAICVCHMIYIPYVFNALQMDENIAFSITIFETPSLRSTYSRHSGCRRIKYTYLNP